MTEVDAEDEGDALISKQIHEQEFVSESSYDAYDYLRLPEQGDGYYNLNDASLVMALDIWSCNRIPEYPLGEYEWRDAFDSQEVRAGIAPFQQKLLGALLRAVENGDLKAKAFARDLDTSAIVPARTYIHLTDIQDFLDTYGYGQGDFIQSILENPDSDPWDTASAIALSRAEFRHGVYSGDLRAPVDASAIGADEVSETIRSLLRELGARKLEIADLTRRLSGQRDIGGNEGKVLTTRERNTLLCILATVCREGGIDYTKAAKSAAAIQKTASEIGLVLAESTIESHLKRIPGAVDSRSRIAK